MAFFYFSLNVKFAVYFDKKVVNWKKAQLRFVGNLLQLEFMRMKWEHLNTISSLAEQVTSDQL